MYNIPFTQYFLPHGRKALMFFGVSDELGVQAQAIIDRGWRFEAEMLTTGEVSLTVSDPIEEIDVAIEVVPNGPEVVDAVTRLIRSNIERTPDAD